MSTTIRLLLALVVVPVQVLIAVFWGGYVCSTLWAWFIVPLGAPAISYLHAVGIGTVLSSFLGARGLPSDHDNSDEAFIRSMIRGFFYGLFIPAFSLAIGWVIHVNMPVVP